MTGILVIVDEENRYTLDLNNRPPELAIALLDKLQVLSSTTNAIVILGSPTMARELQASLDEDRAKHVSCYHFPISCLPKAELICSALAIQFEGNTTTSLPIDCLSLVSGSSGLLPLNHEGRTVQKAFFQTINALSSGEIANAQLLTADLQRHIVDADLGDLKADFRLATHWLKGVLDMEERVLFPSFSRKSSDPSPPEVQYQRRSIAEQLCTEGVFRYIPNQEALLKSLAMCSCYSARKNLLSTLGALASHFTSEVSKGTFDLAGLTVFLSHVSYLIGKSRHSVTSGDPLNGYAFAFRAMEVAIYLEMLLCAKATFCKDKIQVLALQRKSGVGELLALVGTEIASRVGQQILNVFDDAAKRRNKCLLGHEFLVPTPLMCSELSNAVVQLAVRQATSHKNGAQIWQTLDDCLFDPRFLEAIRIAFLNRLFRMRTI
jgi:hypothetical protein